MHLVVLVPALNEEGTVGDVIAALPPVIPGITRRTVLVVDDGSTDATCDQATFAGADEVIRHVWNRGLAEAFRSGRERALALDADILVTLDADGQYDPRELPRLLGPILARRGDVVIGERPVLRCSHMRLGNRVGNIVGSALLRLLIGLPVRDASSGYRAFSKDALLRMEIASRHTYTHETLLRAHAERMRIITVPISFHPRRFGESKLVRTLWNHLARSTGTILRCMVTVEPLRTFARIGGSIFLIGLLLFLVSFVQPFPWLRLSAFILGFIALQLVLVGLLVEVLRSKKA